MKVFLFEGIKIHSPDNLEEMKKVMLNLLGDGSGLKKNESPFTISFINPEIFLKQNRRKEVSKLHQYFLKSRYNFLDGIGIIYAINSRLGTFYDIKNRYPGTDFFDYLPDYSSLKKAGRGKIRLFLYGAKEEFNKKACENLLKDFDNIEISGRQDGYSEIPDEDLVRKINDSGSEILIVCKGCPMQELWIHKNLSKLKVKLVFGNGGSIDFWSGAVKRAPKRMIDFGFEWLFRLTQDLSLRRIKRIVKIFKFYVSYKSGRYKIEYLREEENEKAG